MELTFLDISKEKTRAYHFNNGKTLLIKEPIHFNESKDGTHRIITKSGDLFQIKPSESWFIKIEGEDLKFPV